MECRRRHVGSRGSAGPVCPRERQLHPVHVVPARRPCGRCRARCRRPRTPSRGAARRSPGWAGSCRRPPRGSRARRVGRTGRCRAPCPLRSDGDPARRTRSPRTTSGTPAGTCTDLRRHIRRRGCPRTLSSSSTTQACVRRPDSMRARISSTLGGRSSKLTAVLLDVRRVDRQAGRGIGRCSRSDRARGAPECGRGPCPDTLAPSSAPPVRATRRVRMPTTGPGAD